MTTKLNNIIHDQHASMHVLARWFVSVRLPPVESPCIVVNPQGSLVLPLQVLAHLMIYLQGVPKKRTFRTEAASSAALAPVREAAHRSPRRWAASLTGARAALEAVLVLKVFFWGGTPCICCDLLDAMASQALDPVHWILEGHCNGCTLNKSWIVENQWIFSGKRHNRLYT